MEKEPTITMELTFEQAYVIMDALETYSRLFMTQFETLEYLMHMDTYDVSLNRHKFDQATARALLEKVKQEMFPGIGSAYIGIQQTNERSKISWDIYQQLRHDISVFKYPNEPLESRGRSFDKPFVVSKQPLPKITIIVGE